MSELLEEAISNDFDDTTSNDFPYLCHILFACLAVRMEACLGVEREVQRVMDKITNVKDQNNRSLEEMLRVVRAAKQELQSGEK